MRGTTHTIEMMQNRACRDGVAVALPSDYTEHDVTMMMDELSLVLFGIYR